MRDWLALIIIILIIAIFIDGLRRMQAARKQGIRISRNAVKADQVDGAEEYSSSEFPAGKARVASKRDEQVAKELNQTVKQKFAAGKVTMGAPQRIPEQVALNLEESVPMLMDSVEFEDEEAPNIANDFEPKEPVIGELDDVLMADVEELQIVAEAEQTETVTSAVEMTPESVDTVTEVDKAEEQEFVEPDEVLIINVMAHKGEKFEGSALLQSLTEIKLKLGDMDIFHRHMDNDGDGPILYSLANMVVPGTFNLAEMEQFKTPGVSLFLGLPIKGDSLEAYEDMVNAARKLAHDLDGELKDENRSVMTNQTIEHGRQRVIEYERKKKLAKV